VAQNHESSSLSARTRHFTPLGLLDVDRGLERVGRVAFSRLEIVAQLGGQGLHPLLSSARDSRAALARSTATAACRPTRQGVRPSVGCAVRGNLTVGVLGKYHVTTAGSAIASAVGCFAKKAIL
jgi:hypothetical protein